MKSYYPLTKILILFCFSTIFLLFCIPSLIFNASAQQGGVANGGGGQINQGTGLTITCTVTNACIITGNAATGGAATGGAATGGAATGGAATGEMPNNNYGSTINLKDRGDKTFFDSATGISFQYPSDWQPASKEYINKLYGNQSTESTITPIAIILPKSLNGASFIVLKETLPYPISIENYFENTKNQLISQGIFINKSTLITINNLNGIKYNLTLPNGSYQTQILFVKDSSGIVVAYIPGIKGYSKNLEDENTMINSFSIG